MTETQSAPGTHESADPERTSTGPTWPASVRVRPPVDPAGGTVEVAELVTGRRFQWNADGLARSILRRDPLPQPVRAAVEQVAAENPDVLRGIRRWYSRGWHPSEQTYLASRRWTYVDEHDRDGEVRRTVMERFLAEDGEPPAEVIPDGARVSLGPSPAPTEETMAQLLLRRRSGRAYVPRAVSRSALSSLLWHGLADVRARRRLTVREDPLSYVAQSFGSAWDFFVIVYDVEGVAPGVYRYVVADHELALVTAGPFRDRMIGVLQGMRSPATAGLTLVLVADMPRYQWRYRSESGLRRLYVETGLIGQYLVVAGCDAGLSALLTPAQRDQPCLDLLGLSRDRYVPMYTLTMGIAPRGGGRDFSGNAGGNDSGDHGAAGLDAD